MNFDLMDTNVQQTKIICRHSKYTKVIENFPLKYFRNDRTA